MKTFIYKTQPGSMGEIYADIMDFDKERGLVLLFSTEMEVIAAIALAPGQFVCEKSICGPEIQGIKQEQVHAS